MLGSSESWKGPWGPPQASPGGAVAEPQTRQHLYQSSSGVVIFIYLCSEQDFSSFFCGGRGFLLTYLGDSKLTLHWKLVSCFSLTGTFLFPALCLPFLCWVALAEGTICFLRYFPGSGPPLGLPCVMLPSEEGCLSTPEGLSSLVLAWGLGLDEEAHACPHPFFLALHRLCPSHILSWPQGALGSSRASLTRFSASRPPSRPTRTW